MTKKAFHIILSFVLSIPCVAQTFSVSPASLQIASGQRFAVTYSLKDGSETKFAAPSSFGGLTLVSGPNVGQSQNMQYIKGQMTSSTTKTWTYYFTADQEGSFTINPASVLVAGKQMSSSAVTITAIKGQDKKQDNKSIEVQIAEKLFMRLSTNKTEVHQGEQLVATYSLYYNLDILNYKAEEMPQFPGFWTSEIDLSKAKTRVENYNGKDWNVFDLKKVILIPQQSGELTLDPLKMNFDIRVYKGGFFYESHPFSDRSNSMKLTVKPLPVTNEPVGFNGAVGDYSMDVTLNKTETKADNPITVTMKISGTGNLKMLSAPVLDLPADFEVYDPDINDNVSISSGVMKGNIEYSFLIIPRNLGEYKIPGFSFSYFDPEKETYITLNSGEYMIVVTGTPTEINTTNITNINKEDINLIGEEIRYIKTENEELKKNSDSLIGTPAFYGFVASPALLFLFLLAYKKRKEKREEDISGMKIRKANRVAQKRLVLAVDFMKKQEAKSFYNSVVNAIWGYLGDKLNMEAGKLTRENVSDQLMLKNINEETIQKLIATLDECEMALFSPGTIDEGMDGVYQCALKLIAELEDKIK